MIRPRIESLVVASKSLEGNPLKNSTQRELHVLLPPGYDESESEEYPVVFLLSGWGSKSRKFLNDDSAFGKALAVQFGEAMQSGKMPKAILAFPDGTSNLGHSQYINSAANGNFLDHLCDELVQAVDQNYKTKKASQFRGITGHSSGGFAAMVACFFRPDVFGLGCSAAGDSFFEAALYPCITATQIEVQASDGLDAFVRLFCTHPNPGSLGGKKFDAMMTLSLAACYAPNLEASAPLYGDLFFDLETGEIDPQIWAKYKAWDPVMFIPEKKSALDQIQFLHLDCGLSDEYAAQMGHRQIAKILKELSFKNFEITEFKGRHSGHHHRFVDRVEKLLKQMDL